MDQAALRLIRRLTLVAGCVTVARFALAADFDANAVYDTLYRDRIYPRLVSSNRVRVAFTSDAAMVLDSTWTGQHVQVWTHTPLERAPNLLSLPATNPVATQKVERVQKDRKP